MGFYSDGFRGEKPPDSSAKLARKGAGQQFLSSDLRVYRPYFGKNLCFESIPEKLET